MIQKTANDKFVATGEIIEVRGRFTMVDAECVQGT